MTAIAAATVGDALGAATDALAAAGVESPRFDAELLLAEASGRDRAALAADPGAAVDPAAGREFGAMVRRRIRREPVAYILGRKGFRRIELDVDRRVLIPRPETELLVEPALSTKRVTEREGRPLRVLDVGTGSGAVALAIADEIDARVTATDTSAPALDVARANADRLQLADRVRFVAGMLPSEDDPEDRDERGGAMYDLIVANLPYVSEREWELLAPEIREFEPRAALVAGPSGLEVIEEFLSSLRPARIATHSISLEVGAGQAARVGELVRAAGYGWVSFRADLAGIQRVVSGGLVITGAR